MGRTINKINNIKQALDSENDTWQRIALMLGWNTWDVGVKDKEIKKIKEEVKGNKKSRKNIAFTKKATKKPSCIIKKFL